MKGIQALALISKFVKITPTAEQCQRSVIVYFSVYILRLFRNVHCHRYLRQNVSQAIDPSSEHRLERVRQLPPPKDAIDIRSILGDTEDKEYPIFRTGSPPDTGVATLATGEHVYYSGVVCSVLQWCCV